VIDLKTVVCIMVLGILMFSAKAYADYSVSLLLNPQYYSYSPDTLFDVPDSSIEKPKLTSEQTIELTGGIQTSSTTYYYLLSTINQLSDDGSSDTEFNVNALFLSHGLNSWELTLGRRISTWGIGYGFRPLDVVQQHDQQTTSLQSITGKNQFALEYFSDMSSWSLLWVNPLQNKDSDDNKSNHQLESVVARYATSRENQDLHALLRYNNENKVQLGLGGIQILTDAISAHGSLLLSQRYQKQIHSLTGQNENFLTTRNPFITKRYNNGLQSLIGLNWSLLSKHNIIMEYWYNDMAYTRQQWNALFELTKAQRALLNQGLAPAASVHDNIAWSASALQTQSLAQHNMMFRWSYDAADWTPTVNTLMSIDDGSSITTLSAIRRYHLFKFEAGLRTFSGHNDTVYGGLLLKKIMYLTLSSEF